MKNVLIINGHPNRESFNFGIMNAYREGAEKAGANVQQIIIADLHFDPNLKYGYQNRMDLEQDLLEAWEKILWADHIVWVHPVWWGGFPALMKGFIDRLFLPGLAFRYRENSVWWDKLLMGKTAHIITTMDQPGWYYRLFFGRPSINQLKKSILEFCGVRPVKVTIIGIIKTSDKTQRRKWTDKVIISGMKLK
ncbi:NAD(P)H-dependent oxidoreductase [Chryseobacterium ginsenosidimutans]|uniref:NAD(P)H-dependent oxidoreductase n=1 Tax=Chryseobacterium ginsenosidimutans TaxID=687846 RepID=UPI0031E43AFD